MRRLVYWGIVVFAYVICEEKAKQSIYPEMDLTSSNFGIRDYGLDH
jgi:hypothetical protein